MSNRSSRKRTTSSSRRKSSMNDFDGMNMGGYGNTGRSGGGIINWLKNRLQRSLRKIFKKVDNRNLGNVDKSKVKVEDTTPKYINEVDSFAKEEPVTIKPVYHYGKKEEDVELLGSDEEGNESKVGEEKDLWDKESITEEDKDYYNQRLAELGSEVPAGRKEIIRHYYETRTNLDKVGVSERDAIRKEVYQLLPLDKVENVPYFLKNGAELELQLKNAIQSKLDDEVKNAYIEEEVKRYRDILKDFMEITEKEGKFFITDWKLGIKVIDFMIKDMNFPEIILLLTPSKVDEMIKVMRTGYLSEYLRETPIEKVLVIFEDLASRMEKSSGNKVYAFPKAYVSYKQQLPMYKKLRNNGRLANVNTLLAYFYNGLDNVQVNADVAGDAYLGLIEPEEFVNAYVQFFYGRAKQSQAMSDVTLKLMKKDETILQEVGDKGYALGDKPKGTLFIVAGHLVVMVNVTGKEYNIILDKAPSDITTEDITNITGMFSTERKKAKQTKPKVKAKPVPEKKPKGMSYDYDSAIKAFSKNKK